MPPKQSQEVKFLLAKLESILTRFEHFETYLGNVSDPLNSQEKLEFEFKLKQFTTLFDKLDDIQLQLHAYHVKIDVDINEVSDRHCRLLAFATNILNQNNKDPNIGAVVSNSNSGPSVPNTNVKLPQINLPNFRGEYEHFRSFIDIFDSMIHNNNQLPDIQKFFYLKSSLQGEAAKLIEALPPSADNYAIARQSLLDRYNNTQHIVNAHLKHIFEIPSVGKDVVKDLRGLINDTQLHLNALKALKLPVQTWDAMVIFLIKQKLDNFSRREWELSLTDPQQLPSLEQFLKFLEHRCIALEAVQGDTQPIKKHPTQKTTTHVATQEKEVTCKLCKGNHYLYACKQFLDQDAQKRTTTVSSLGICSNCLRSGHLQKECKSRSCKHCTEKHNSLLHRQDDQPNKKAVVTTSYAKQINRQNLLTTAIVTILDADGNLHSARALLDSGSQSNLMTDELCKKLKLKTQQSAITITGINRQDTSSCFSATTTIQSNVNRFSYDTSFLILPHITSNLPSTTLNIQDTQIPDIPLADPQFYKSSSIDILIGVDLFWKLLKIGRITSNPVSYQNTQLGWVAWGSLPSRFTMSMVCSFLESSLRSDLMKFWSLEECSPERRFSPEEQKCENNYVNTTSRSDEGRYIVSLPLKDDSSLGDSQQLALKRFRSLESRLDKDQALKLQYQEFMNEYETLQHMEKIDPAQTTSNLIYYMPHHPVIKETSATTKLRVVFDASMKSTNGQSLNDILLIGPTIQDDLFSILMRFRFHRYVLLTDIVKMYRQVEVKPEHRDLQRILWRDQEGDMQTYRLKTVTYGTSSAPFLAIRTLQELANDPKLDPLISKTIREDFYVDDLITGADDVETLTNVRDGLIAALSQGGFHLNKWASNSDEVLIDLRNKSDSQNTIIFDKANDIKTLGLLWNSESDSFHFEVAGPSTHPPTKRTILSSIAKLFDPLGLLGAAIIVPKIIIQRLWQLQIDWDDPLPEELVELWNKFRHNLQEVNKLDIPRHIARGIVQVQSVQLHGFCDASESAYGACLYIRVTNNFGEHSVTLLCSKSRVAPLKKVTLPRLELCGALLLAQLIHKVQQALRQHIEVYTWTDSTIVLSWLSAPSRNWKTFVANRVAEIQELTSIENWRHVRTHDNPADFVSRGIQPDQLPDLSAWWYGPAWLKCDVTSWPSQNEIPPKDVPELRVQESTETLVTTAEESFSASLFKRFSSYQRLIRTVAYILRFQSICLRKSISKEPLSTSELHRSTICVVRLVQRTAFQNEYKALKTPAGLSHKSSISQLNPFIDSDDIIRVGGRLDHSHFDYSKRHPILLPNHYVTTLILREEHCKQMHCGPQTLLASVRERYWPLSGRNLCRKTVHSCITCFKAKPRPASNLMGHLPKFRFDAQAPFCNTGIDYCGPVLIKDRYTRNPKSLKAYICIFICCVTKAIHLEVVTSLTTKAFLDMLKRFIARRGKPKNLYSDNGSNFLGAARELKELYQHLKTTNTQLIDNLSRDNISWHFNPPRAPHMGGLWEAGVKSAKFHLKRVVGNTMVTYEELSTICAQIEAILNTRPLSPLSSSPSDFSPLTPGHFLIGRPLTSLPDIDLTETPRPRLARFQLYQQMVQHFWRRWQKEYIGELQSRLKWKWREGNLKEGDLVILHEDNLPPLSWRMGRVQQIHTGHDGVVRVVTIRRSDGAVFTRPIVKVCPLPDSCGGE